MRDVLERAKAAGVTTLVFTVDMPVPGARYRDVHSAHERPERRTSAAWCRPCTHPAWAWDVGLNGTPHTLGNVSPYLGKPTGLADFMGWIGANFDPSICGRTSNGSASSGTAPMVIKGILDPDDARDAVAFGADGIVVSNHGGRQLDGVLSTARALPPIADAVKGKLTILADGGVRSGSRRGADAGARARTGCCSAAPSPMRWRRADRRASRPCWTCSRRKCGSP